MEDGQLWCANGPMCQLPKEKKGLKLKAEHKLCMGDLCVGNKEFQWLSRSGGQPGKPGQAAPGGAAGQPIQDTRGENSSPEQYYGRGRGVYREFKTASVIGVPTKNTFCHLETIVNWNDPSGGPIYQYAHCGQREVYTRISIGTNKWERQFWKDAKWGNWENVAGSGSASGPAKAGSGHFKKDKGWAPSVMVDAPVHPESLYSLHFGDGKDLHGRQAGMGYIKDQPNRLFGNTRGTLATHVHEADDLQWYSSGWKPIFGVKGGSGNTWVRGDLSAKEGKVKIQDNIEIPNGELRISPQGIMLGGPNKDREHNSAQITAGKHIANSLNLVGMSSGKGAGDRRVDMWAEGGFNVHGHVHVHNTANFRGGLSNQNPQGWGTHFPWHGDNKNYIRGDTEMRGHTNQMGVLRAATNVGPADANSEQLIIGNTHESNLRLGRHKDYSWIQSHGSKPLLVNPLGNELRVKDIVVEGNIIMRHPNGQEWVIGMRDANHFAINKIDRTGKNKGDGSGMLIRADGHVFSGGGPFHQGSHNPNWHNDWQHNIHKGRR